jgi:uncharacterized protein YegL
MKNRRINRKLNPLIIMNNQLTEIAYILDRSGSMQNLQKDAIQGFNTFLKEQQAEPGDVNFTLVLFDDEYLLHADRTPIQEVRKLTKKSYVPRGCTALLDAIGRTIDNIGKQLANTPEPERPAKVIIAIYTDGYENASTDYTAQQISKMIRKQTNTYSWEFLFLAANEDAIATAANYGIAASQASSVHLSSNGMRSSWSSVSRKVRAHRAVSRGDASEDSIQDIVANLASIVEEEQKH